MSFGSCSHGSTQTGNTCCFEQQRSISTRCSRSAATTEGRRRRPIEGTMWPMHVGLSPMRLVEVRIALGGDGMFRTLRIGLLVVLLTPCAISAGVPSGHMEAVSVSPDGKLLAGVYGYQDEHGVFIYKIAVETGVATRLTEAKSGWESSPTFSADGKQIAFSYESGNGEQPGS